MAPILLYLCIYFYSYIVLEIGGAMWRHSGTTWRHGGLQTLGQPTLVHTIVSKLVRCVEQTSELCLIAHTLAVLWEEWNEEGVSINMR